VGAVCNGAGDICNGTGDICNGAGDICNGTGDICNGAGDICNGAGDICNGAGDICNGAGDICSGAGDICNGAGDICSGAGDICNGAGDICNGAGGICSGAGAIARIRTRSFQTRFPKASTSQQVEHQNLFDRMAQVNAEIDRMLEGDPNPLEPKVDPRFIELLEEGIAVSKELDLLMRGTFRTEATIAWWEQKMKVVKECDAEGYLEELKERYAKEN
jgi:hypothetical protein